MKDKDSFIDGLMQERRNSTTNALKLCLSCTNPSVWYIANAMAVDDLVMQWAKESVIIVMTLSRGSFH